MWELTFQTAEEDIQTFLSKDNPNEDEVKIFLRLFRIYVKDEKGSKFREYFKSFVEKKSPDLIVLWRLCIQEFRWMGAQQFSHDLIDDIVEKSPQRREEAIRAILENWRYYGSNASKDIFSHIRFSIRELTTTMHWICKKIQM